MTPIERVDLNNQPSFEKESSGKSSWKFCNKTALPRPEVVFCCSNVCHLVANVLMHFKVNCTETEL